MRKLIKYRSADGLVLYESWACAGHPAPTRERVVLMPLKLQMKELEASDLVSTLRRTYEIYDHYIDWETGNEVYEYREKL